MGWLRATERWAAPPGTRWSRHPAALLNQESGNRDKKQKIHLVFTTFVCFHDFYGMWEHSHLLQERQVTAALSQAQQQGQDVEGAGRLLGLLGVWQSSVSLGHTKLLGHWREDTQTYNASHDYLSVTSCDSFSRHLTSVKRIRAGGVSFFQVISFMSLQVVL